MQQLLINLLLLATPLSAFNVSCPASAKCLSSSLSNNYGTPPGCAGCFGNWESISPDTIGTDGGNLFAPSCHAAYLPKEAACEAIYQQCQDSGSGQCASQLLACDQPNIITECECTLNACRAQFPNNTTSSSSTATSTSSTSTSSSTSTTAPASTTVSTTTTIPTPTCSPQKRSSPRSCERQYTQCIRTSKAKYQACMTEVAQDCDTVVTSQYNACLSSYSSRRGKRYCDSMVGRWVRQCKNAGEGVCQQSLVGDRGNCEAVEEACLEGCAGS